MQWPNLKEYGLTLTLHKRAGESDQLCMTGAIESVENALAACGFVEDASGGWRRDGNLPLRTLRDVFVGMTLEDTDPADVVVVEPAAAAAPDATPKGRSRRTAAAERIEDFGEHIGGARKDRWDRERGIRGENVEEWTPEERAELLTKDRVWPRPDYKALLAEGADLGVLARIRKIRSEVDPFPAKVVRVVRRLGQQGRRALRPSSAAARQDEYLEAVGALADALSTVRTREEFAEACEQYVATRVVTKDGSDGRPPKERQRSVTDAGATVADHMASQKKSRWLLPFELFNATTLSRDAAAAEREGWPLAAKQVARRRGAREEEEPVRQPLSHIVRKGGPKLREDDVRPEDFAETFGFRGGEFGNWVSQAERQACLNHGFDALADLAHVLDVPPRALSLGGTLAIAFGARGRGGRASAHYEPGRRVINLTKPSGAGALAHEFGHAMDHWLATVGSGNVDFTHPFVSAKEGEYLLHWGGPQLDASLVPAIDAMNAFVASAKRRDLSEAEVRTRLEAAATANVEHSRAWANWLLRTAEGRLVALARKDVVQPDDALIARLEQEAQASPSIQRLREAVDRVKNVAWMGDDELASAVGEELCAAFVDVVGMQRYEGECHAARAAIKSARDATRTLADPEEVAFVVASASAVTTKYFETSRAWDGQKPAGKEYYAAPWEMFARAFETCVENHLTDEGMQSDYLVHSTRYRAWSEHAKGSPYPVGEDLNVLLTRFEDVKTHVGDLMRAAMAIADAEAEAEPKKVAGPGM